MTDEKRILAEGTAMAARCGTLESATDFILQHDKTVERFSKIEVLDELSRLVLAGATFDGIMWHIGNMENELKAGI